VVATLHQFLLRPWGKGIYFQQRFVSANVDQYTAVSAAVGQQLSEDFQVPARKIRVIHNGIPCDAYERPADGSLRKMLTRGTDCPVVLTAARLDRQKGHRFLLEAACQVPEAIFVLAGSGPERPVLEALARKLGVDDRVLFLGQRADIPALLASCDLFVLPSLYEGFPLSILEAMAAGRAVVATAVGGTPEAITDGESGLLTPPGDSAALAKAIREVLSDPSLAGKMGATGKARVRQQFSVGAMAQQVSQVYEHLLDQHT
jgi:glycosyltransferase involved in cell wall biosynthesis